MQLPLEITFRGIDEEVKKKPIESLIRERSEKLEKFCDHIISCRVAVEQRHKHNHSHNPYRIRIDVTVPPQHEIIVDREPLKGDTPLPRLIRDAFETAERQLKQLVQKQRHEVKTHAKEVEEIEHIKSSWPEPEEDIDE